MRRACLVVALAGVVLVIAPMVLGLGGKYATDRNKPNWGATHLKWPAGLADMVNSKHRVAGHWVNPSDEFFFKGTSADFNRFLQQYAKLADTPLTLVIHAGSARRSALWGKEPAIRYDWKLLSLHRGFMAVRDPQRFQKKTGYEITVDLWIDSQVKLEEIAVPVNVNLKSGGEIDTFIKAHQEKRGKKTVAGKDAAG